MSIAIRPLGPTDGESVIELFLVAYPERAHEPATWARSAALERARRWVVTEGVGGSVIGYVALWCVECNRYRMDLVIKPELRRRGCGSELLGWLQAEARRDGAGTLQARAESADLDSLRFLQRRGFVETMRMHRMVLRVAEAKLEPFTAVEADLARHDIALSTLKAEELREPELWEKLADLYEGCREGWPDPDPGPGEAWSAERLREWIGRSQRDRAAFFLARRGDFYVGFTGNLGTGVRPRYRNLGIATALKVRAIQHARAVGVVQLRSASGNPSLLRVNEKLGYRLTTTEVRLVLRLDTREPSA